MLSPKIAIVPHMYARQEVIDQAIANPKTPLEIARLIDENEESTYFEIVSKKCIFYADFDCDIKPEDEENYDIIRSKVLESVYRDLDQLGVPTDEDKLFLAERSGRNGKGVMKVSFRAFCPSLKTTQDRALQIIRKYKSINPLSCLDLKVYSHQRKMGLLYCIKELKGQKPGKQGVDDKRRLMPFNRKIDRISFFYNTLISLDEESAKDLEEWIPPIDFDDGYASTSSEVSVVETHASDDDEYPVINGMNYIEDLVNLGAKGIKFNSDSTFVCNWLDDGVECPCCDGNHTSNQYRLKEEAGNILLSNFSEKCRWKTIKKPGFMFLGVPDITPLAETPVADMHDDDGFEIDGKAEEYEAKKIQFEKRVAMIEKPKPHYIVDDEEYFLKKDLVELFQAYKCKSAKKQFTDTWFRDPTKRKYTRKDFLPQGAGDDVYNLWRGYKVEELTCSTEGADLEPFMRWLNAMTDNKPEYLVKTLALMFQKPHEKTRTAIIIKSEQGGGKNSGFDFLGNEVMGNDLYNVVVDPANDLFGNATIAMERKKLVICNEANLYNFTDKLKPLITDPTTRVKRLYVDAGNINNYAQMIVLTNHAVPVKIEPDDRRFAVYEANTDLKGDEKFWNYFHKEWSKNPVNQKAVYEYLMGVDIANYNFDAERPVEADAYIEMRNISLPREIKFVSHFITHAFPRSLCGEDDTIKATEFFRVFENFVGRTNDEISPNLFGQRLRAQLKKFGVYSEKNEERKAFHKIRGEDGVKWKIDRRLAYEWLREKRFTTSSLEDPISYYSNDGYGGGISFDPSRIRRTF